jgi:hypothetical protein
LKKNIKFDIREETQISKKTIKEREENVEKPRRMLLNENNIREFEKDM